MASIFERVINVIDNFDSYNHIEQIANLSSRVKTIRTEVTNRVRKDFEESFGNPFTKMNVQHGSDLCRMVDVLDDKVKMDLIKWFLKHELSEYGVLFEENQENSWLDKIDRRYSWIKRNLGEFEEKFSKIFPTHWDMSERLAVEFCEITKKELTNVMLKRKLEIDNKLLIFAIQRTINFEQLLTKRFLGRTISDPMAFSLTQQNGEINKTADDFRPFIGIISQCFDAYFEIYANFTDQ
jgi:vacuolar protein sorting-associated protein 53